METVLITGGSGTIGTHLLGEIVRQGLDRQMLISCAARSDAAAAKIERHGLTAVRVDFDEPETVRAAVAGVTTVFLLKPYSLRMLNHAKTVVDAAAAADVRNIVNVSAFGPNSSAIDLLTWHRLVDGYIERSGLSFTHLRPGFFMEGLAARIDPVAGAVSDLSAGRDIPWVAAADIARVAASIIADPVRHAGKAYPLVSEIASAPGIASLMTELSGLPFAVAPAEPGRAIDALIGRGREPLFARAIVEYAEQAPAFPFEAAVGAIDETAGTRGVSLREFLSGTGIAKMTGVPA